MKTLFVVCLLVVPVAAVAVAKTTKPQRVDSDHDGLSNRLEQRLHTNAHRVDTDRDRLSDGAEVLHYHTNPRKKDTDGDGLSDYSEIRRHHTNPRKRDTDGDGFSDLAEIRAHTNPRSRKSHPSGPPPSPVSGTGTGTGTGTGSSGSGGRPPTASPTPAPPVSAPGSPNGFPNPATTGVPAGWVPARVINGDYTVGTAGAVVQDIQVNGNINITAPNVTLRRVDVRGGSINNLPGGSRCQNGMVIEDSTVEAGSSADTTDFPAVLTGGYTARRVKIWNRGEGFRVGGKSDGGCGPVNISDSFVKIMTSGSCADVHSDGLQGYDGNALAISNTTIDFNRTGPCEGAGTSPFFYVDNQGNTSATVNGLLVMGGGINFRLKVPGSVTGLKVVDRSWGYGPLDVICSLFSHWDAQLVNIDANYQVTHVVRSLACQ